MRNEHTNALGMLTVSYSLLDAEITRAACLLMQCRSFEVAQGVIVPLPFRNKIELLKRLITMHSTELALANTDAVRNLQDAIRQGDEAAKRRNEIVHSHIYFQNLPEDFLYWDPKKGVKVAIDANDIQATATDCMNASVSIHLLTGIAMRLVLEKQSLPEQS